MTHYDWAMIATKPFTYGTRKLQPGDEFGARNRNDFLILKGIGKARPADVREPTTIAPPPSKVVEKAQRNAPQPKAESAAPSQPTPSASTPASVTATSLPVQGGTDLMGGDEKKSEEPLSQDHIKQLRIEYQNMVGKAPFNGWTEEQLQAKIDEAKAKS